MGEDKCPKKIIGTLYQLLNNWSSMDIKEWPLIKITPCQYRFLDNNGKERAYFKDSHLVALTRDELVKNAFDIKNSKEKEIFHYMKQLTRIKKDIERLWPEANEN